MKPDLRYRVQMDTSQSRGRFPLRKSMDPVNSLHISGSSWEMSVTEYPASLMFRQSHLKTFSDTGDIWNESMPVVLLLAPNFITCQSLFSSLAQVRVAMDVRHLLRPTRLASASRTRCGVPELLPLMSTKTRNCNAENPCIITQTTGWEFLIPLDLNLACKTSFHTQTRS